MWKVLKTNLIFENTNSKLCPLTCGIYEDGVNIFQYAENRKNDDTKVWLNKAQDLVIRQDDRSLGGWKKEKVTIKCSNTVDTKETIQFTVSQAQSKCFSSLTPIPQVSGTYSEDFSTTELSGTVAFKNFFTNSNSVDCPITKCTLYMDDGSKFSTDGNQTVSKKLIEDE